MKLITGVLKRLSAFKTWFIKTPLIIKIVFLVIIALVAWFTFSKIKSSQQKPQYQTTQVQKGPITSTVSASGQILTTNIVNITTGANGTVAKVLVKDGDTLNVGDEIAEITLDSQGQQQNTQAWSAYLSAKNNLESANYTAYSLQSDMFTKWKKFVDLATSSTYQNSDGSPREDQRTAAEFHVAQDDWLGSEAKYKAQQAVIAQAQAAVSSSWLSYTQSSPQITAPIAGTIENVTIIPGMTLAGTTTTTTVGTGNSSASTSSHSSQNVAVIKNAGSPIATFNLSEVDITKVKNGQEATLTLDSIPDKTFVGKVASVDRIGTVSSGVTNYQVLITFESDVPEILPNMSATANIIVDSKDNVLQVPTTAIQTSNGQTTVRVLANGQVTSIPVETGIASDSETEITSGLSEGQTVVTAVIQSTTSSSTGSTSIFGSSRAGGFGGAARIGGGGR